MEKEVERWVLASNYPVELRPRIKNDLQANLTQFPAFHLTHTTFRENNTVNKVVALEGQLRVLYQNTSYGVPIICILPFRYPFSGPVVYVRNPANTSLQPSCCLSADGLVSHPAISSWDHKKSSLSNILREIAKSFQQYFPIVASASAPVPSLGTYSQSLSQTFSFTSSNSLYPDLQVPSVHHNFRLNRENPHHLPYFELEEKIRYLEADIHGTCLYLEVSPDDPAKVIIELKKKFYELFILNRKIEKLVIILSKLG